MARNPVGFTVNTVMLSLPSTEGETEAGSAQAPAQSRGLSRQAGRTAVASGALARLHWAAALYEQKQTRPTSRACAAGSKPALCPPRRPRGPGDFN